MASSNPIQLSNHVYYLAGGVNTAIVTNNGGEAIFVDTGGDKDYGRKLRKACEQLDVKPVAIVNTHSHADHYGGNDYLVRNFGLPVYAPPFEGSIIQSPYLEPVYLFGGAKPLPEMMSKWLLAKPSPVDHVVEAGKLELHNITFELIDTSGHAHTQLAVLVDDVLLAADAVFGEAALNKYPLPFGQDIGKQLESAQKIAGIDAKVVLPGHGEPTTDLSGLAQANVTVFRQAADAVADACTGVDTATVLKQTCDALGVAMTDLPRYYLNLCTVMAYLSYLRDEERVQLTLADNELRWQKR